ncbi:amidohydrolase [Agaribacterium sp. ZY112]|uniref:amidohydrolase n=1 Tax=Agaribacterium sp. ZY112 TaxID=3233574 RepID=UPI0035245CCC
MKTSLGKMAGVFLSFSVLLGQSALASDVADTIYTNGKIYTVNQQQVWAEAVAIRDAKFIEVGSNKEVNKFKGPNTKLIDLRGKFVMPGIIDEHIHPDMGADNYLNIFISASDDWQSITKTIREFRKNNPDKKWLYGGTLNWLADNNGLIAGTTLPSNKSSLDAIVADRPVALWDQGAHAMLLNSMALKELGITKDITPPAGGIFVKDDKGELTGVFRETAATLVTNALDQYPDDIWASKGMQAFLNEMSSYGVTGINDAYGVKRNLDAYTALEKQSSLKHWVHISLATPLEFNDPKQKTAQDALIRNAAHYRTERIRPNAVKYILDGSAAGQTAAMLDPFHGTDFRGDLRYSFNDVKKDMAVYVEQGFATKVHGIGDRAIRGALDIYANLPKATLGTSHSIAHGTFIAPEDIKRFHKLGVVYEASPALWFPNDGEDIIRKDIGDRTDRSWPIKALVENGAKVSYGSDWTVSLTPSPWPGLESMITREAPGGSDRKLGAQFAVDLATGIKILTLNGAQAIGLGQKTGSIETGKQADMIILGHNLFEIDVHKIHQTQVEKTIYAGQEVYAK